LASKLDHLRAMTTVVADTGDLCAVARLKPVDCTTNPTIVLKAVDAPDYRDVVDEALAWGRKQSGDAARVAAATADRLLLEELGLPYEIKFYKRDAQTNGAPDRARARLHRPLPRGRDYLPGSELPGADI
jgi:hypothetical protein